MDQVALDLAQRRHNSSVSVHRTNAQHACLGVSLRVKHSINHFVGHFDVIKDFYYLVWISGAGDSSNPEHFLDLVDILARIKNVLKGAPLRDLLIIILALHHHVDPGAIVVLKQCFIALVDILIKLGAKGGKCIGRNLLVNLRRRVVKLLDRDVDPADVGLEVSPCDLSSYVLILRHH